MLKKMICLFIVTVLVFSCFGISYSNNYTEGPVIYDYSERSITEEAVDYLVMLNLLETVDTEKVITRGQAISLVMHSLVLDDGMNSEEHIAQSAYSQGLISGDNSADRRLNDSITLEESAKLMVLALGYPIEEKTGELWSSEYLMYASKLKLLDGIHKTRTDELTWGDFAILLSHTMKSLVVESTNFSTIKPDDEFQITYEKSESDTLEQHYLEKKEWFLKTGIVEADHYSTMVYEGEFKKNIIRIDGIEFSVESDEFYGYVGNKVEYVFSEEAAETGRKIIGMKACTSNTTYEFKPGYDISFRDNSLFYTTNNSKEKRLSANGAVYLYNNELLISYDISGIDLKFCQVTAIENNNDNNLDVIYITESESMFVDYVKDNKIYLKDGTVNSKSVINIEEFEDHCLIINDLYANKVLPEDITEKSPVSIIASKSMNYLKIILLNSEFTGSIQTIDSEENIISIDGNEYKVKDNVADLKFGIIYKIWTDNNGFIFHMKESKEAFAYLVAKAPGNGLSKDIQIKLYVPGSGMTVFEVENRVKINDMSYSDNQSVLRAIPTDELVRYSINSKGKINKLETLEKYGENASRIYRSQVKGFNDIDNNASVPFRFDDDTAFFYVPLNGDDEEFGKLLKLENGTEYMTQAYEYDVEDKFVDAVVITIDTEQWDNVRLDSDSDVAIIDRVYCTRFDNDEFGYVVKGFCDGEAFEYYSAEDSGASNVLSSLKQGDVVRFETDYNEEIVKMEVIARLSQTNDFYHDGADTVDEQFFGPVIMLDKNTLTNYSKYLFHEMSVSTSLSYDHLVNMRIYADLDNPYDSDAEFSAYYYYDRENKEVRLASIDDIVPYSSAGEGATRVFVQRSKSNVQCIVIVDND